MDTQHIGEFDLLDGTVLRPFGDEDIPAVFEVVTRNYEHLRPYMHWASRDYSMHDAENFISNSIASRTAGRSIGLGLFRSDNFVGSIGFVTIDRTNKRAEIGYWIDKGEEGKGTISRACRRLIDYAFDELQMNRIEIRCSTENLRSSAVPERLGFKKEGVLRESEMRDGRLHDFVVYGLLRSEWPNKSINI